jgi:NAD-dependent SIR2 family protein deacetylase
MLDRLVSLLAGRRLVVLTGAGCSTESGIPDYRGPGTARRARNPVQYREFIHDAKARQRYWARAVIGWSKLSQARPNRAHHSLARLEQGGLLQGLLTQNVDRLHRAAGSEAVIELHGALSDVRCLACGRLEGREAFQARLLSSNPGWLDRYVEAAPDGDAELPAEFSAGFELEGCLDCGGPMKPDVVFFGENVPRERVEKAYSWVDEGEALLVVGSSLTVFSGYRFVKRAFERGTPIGIVNLGPSRGDPQASVLVDAPAGEVLPQLERQLLAA